MEEFRDHLRRASAAQTADSYARWATKAERWSDSTGARVTSNRLVYDFAAHLASSPDGDGKRHAPSTIRVGCAALRRYLDWLALRGYPVAQQVRAEIQHAQVEVQFTPDDAGVGLFLTAVDAELREPYAVLAHVLAGTGMRVGEAVTILGADVAPSRDDGLTRGWLIFTLRQTKNHQSRQVPLLPEYEVRLRRYVSRTRPDLLGDEPHDYLFPVRRKAKPVSRTEVARKLSQVGQRIGIPITPHALRRFYVTSLMRRGVEAATIMKVIGHTDADTFGRYYKPTAEDLVGKLSQSMERGPSAQRA